MTILQPLKKYIIVVLPFKENVLWPDVSIPHIFRCHGVAGAFRTQNNLVYNIWYNYLNVSKCYMYNIELCLNTMEQKLIMFQWEMKWVNICTHKTLMFICEPFIFHIWAVTFITVTDTNVAVRYSKKKRLNLWDMF